MMRFLLFFVFLNGWTIMNAHAVFDCMESRAKSDNEAVIRSNISKCANPDNINWTKVALKKFCSTGYETTCSMIERVFKTSNEEKANKCARGCIGCGTVEWICEKCEKSCNNDYKENREKVAWRKKPH